MSKITQSKPVPAPTVYVDNFRITSAGIEAYCLINKKSVDFHINQIEFEMWCEKEQVREFYFSDVETPWSEIYAGWEALAEFLRQYIEHLYIKEATDIETPLKQILSSHKVAI